MRALFIHGKQQASVDEVPMPEPGNGQVRLRMAYAGICGSDIHYYFDGANGTFVVREPLVPGHEVSGTVDLDPSGTYEPGTPVTVHPATFGEPLAGIEGEEFKHLWPGGSYLGSASTWPHTQGGMQEYLIVEDYMIRTLPEGMSLKAAALAEPLAVGLHGIELGGGVEGKKVLVAGSGPIGFLLAAAAVVRGASEVVCTDMLPGPLERAEAVGATSVVQVGVGELPDSHFDIAFECSGAPSSVSSCIAATRRAGQIVQVGMMSAGEKPIVYAPFIQREQRLVGSFRFNEEISDAVEMLAAHPELENVITHVFSADDFVAAFDTAKDSDASGKVLVELWAE